MNNYIFNVNGKKLKRVNKTTAKKVYETGKTVYFIPCNLSPVFGGGVFLSPVDKATTENENNDYIHHDFLYIVNAFQFYNCMNTETGRYTAFYVEL